MRSLHILLSGCLLALAPLIQHATGFLDEQELTRLKSYSAEAQQRGQALNQLVESLQNKTFYEQLKQVNRFFNHFTYTEDQRQWGEKDYWMTPEEFLGTAEGDCEDYVVAKYFVLRHLGVPDERLYLTYVKALEQNVAHMVLSYFATPGSIPLILDNYNPAILPGDQRKDLLPVYSFNAKSLFLTNASAGLGRSLPTDKIKNNKWQKLLAEIRKDQP